jgi:hypothetical protein
MRKYLILLSILCFTFINCEKDDICIDTTTPKLIIVFYDNEIPTEIKKRLLDSVWVDGKNSIKEFEKQTLDSIAIPLDLNQNKSKYVISSNSIIDTIEFTYDRKDIFVSRSCGYKTIFENLQIESITRNWIKNDTIKNTTIDNETAAHLTIFH